MLAVGYADQLKAFIVRNSWEEDWGEKGYCCTPYAYMSELDYCFDPWTVYQLETDDMGYEHWDDDDSIGHQEDEEEEE